MSKNYIITDGPLYGHYAESDTYPVFQGKEAFRTGLRAVSTAGSGARRSSAADPAGRCRRW